MNCEGTVIELRLPEDGVNKFRTRGSKNLCVSEETKVQFMAACNWNCTTGLEVLLFLANLSSNISWNVSYPFKSQKYVPAVANKKPYILPTLERGVFVCRVFLTKMWFFSLHINRLSTPFLGGMTQRNGAIGPRHFGERNVLENSGSS